VLLVAAILVATPAGIVLGAGEPSPAGQEPAEPECEESAEPEGKEPAKGEQEEEKKGFWSRFKDPEDGKLDIMAAGEQKAGLFPMAIPFNEPATGPGLVLALGYFHPTKAGAPTSSEGRMAPPTATFGAGAATTNGTWFAAAGHHHVWKDDSIRYLGAVGGGSINLTFFGYGDDGTGEDEGFDFTIDVTALIQQGKFRVAQLPIFLGARYVYAATDTTFDIETGRVLTGESDLAGISGLFEYDTRDTVFTPNEGLQATLDISWFSEALGGDFDFGSVKTGIRYYWHLAEPWILGFRGDYNVVGDEAPFYALSWVKLRGVPVFRYLGNYVATLEVEPRFKIDGRWSVVAFAGAGRAATEFSNLSDADRAYGIGTGFRYLIARKLGLGIGIDIARGPEETVGYLTIGSAW
jgi:hypothetical protein